MKYLTLVGLTIILPAILPQPFAGWVGVLWPVILIFWMCRDAWRGLSMLISAQNAPSQEYVDVFVAQWEDEDEGIDPTQRH